MSNRIVKKFRGLARKFGEMTKKEMVSFAIFLICIIGTIVLNCSALAWGVYSSNIDGVDCSYTIKGDIFQYKAQQGDKTACGIGLYYAHQSGSGETVISFVNIEENGGGSITVRRNNAFSFTYAYFGGKEYQFFNGWALCRQLIYVVGMVGGAIYLIPWLFGMKENDDKSIE